LYRCAEGARAAAAEEKAEDFRVRAVVVGRCTLNQVDP
jgi:hypothetical protein